MRKKLAMVVLGLSLAVGVPAASNMFPATAVQTVEAAVQTGWVKESGTWYFYKDGAKQTGWQTWDGKRYKLVAKTHRFACGMKATYFLLGFYIE